MPLSDAQAKPAFGDFYYASHLPVLRALPRVGSIIEAGAGRYSTPVLAAMCDDLRSWDAAPRWCEKLTREAQGAYVVNCSGADMVAIVGKAMAERLPDLIMIDNGTAGIERTNTRGALAVMALQAGVRYVVLHDTEPVVLTVYNWQEAFRIARYKIDWPGTWYGQKQPDGRGVPWTSVLSMTDDLADVRRNLRMP